MVVGEIRLLHECRSVPDKTLFRFVDTKCIPGCTGVRHSASCHRDQCQAFERQFSAFRPYSKAKVAIWFFALSQLSSQERTGGKRRMTVGLLSYCRTSMLRPYQNTCLFPNQEKAVYETLQLPLRLLMWLLERPPKICLLSVRLDESNCERVRKEWREFWSALLFGYELRDLVMSCYTEALHRTQRAKRDEKSKRKQHKSNEESWHKIVCTSVGVWQGPYEINLLFKFPYLLLKVRHWNLQQRYKTNFERKLGIKWNLCV